MSDIDGGLAALRVPFPPEAIGQIPKAGITLDYVGHAHVTERLLDCDPAWSWEPVAFTESGAPLITRRDDTALLWIKLTICGVTRYGVGSCDAGKHDAEKELIGDAIRNAAMRFGVALDLWKKDGPVVTSGKPTARKVATGSSGGSGTSSGQASSPAPGGNADDPWLDLLHNPDGWFDNREGKKNPKAPDFKAKNGNPHWGQAGEPYRGKPAGLALWLRDAPPHFVEAFDAGDPSLMTDDGPTGRGGTVADAVAALDAKVVDEEPPFFAPGEEPM